MPFINVNKHNKASFSLSQPKSSYPEASIDSACTGNYIGRYSNINIKNVSRDEDPLSITTAGSETLTSIYNAELPIEIRVKAKECKIIDGMNENLISVGQLCDNDYEVHFNSKKCYVIDQLNNKVVMIANRDHSTGMYIYQFNDKNSIVFSLKKYQSRITFQSQAEVTDYWSKTFGNPTDSTFIHALRYHKDIKIPGL